MPHALLIRPATAADEAFARDCHHRAMRDVVVRQFGPWDEAMQDRFFDAFWRGHDVQIVELDGSPCGYLGVTEYDDAVHVVELVLHPDAHGRGIGTHLLRDVFALGKPVQLQVLHENHRARALYERLGFAEIDRTPTHHVMRRLASGGARSEPGVAAPAGDEGHQPHQHEDPQRAPEPPDAQVEPQHAEGGRHERRR